MEPNIYYTPCSFGTLPKQRSSTKVPLETHFNVIEPGNDHNKSETWQFYSYVQFFSKAKFLTGKKYQMKLHRISCFSSESEVIEAKSFEWVET